jgi:hypothetical protein
MDQFDVGGMQRGVGCVWEAWHACLARIGLNVSGGQAASLVVTVFFFA